MIGNDITNFLFRMVFAIPFGIGAVFFFIKGIKRFDRFLFQDYFGSSKERFKDNLISNLYICLGAACIIITVMWIQIDVQNIKPLLLIIPTGLCVGAFVLPISVLGAYWRSYQMNKLWGGFMPTIRANHGYAQPESAKQQKIDPVKIKVPRRVTITAAATALLIFFGMLFLLSKVQWNGPAWVGILFPVLFSGLMAFSVFMIIISTSLSRRIQKLRNGDLLDDD